MILIYSYIIIKTWFLRAAIIENNVIILRWNNYVISRGERSYT